MNIIEEIKERFVWVYGAVEEQLGYEVPRQSAGDVVLWDRQERKAVVTLHSGYGNLFCLELTDAPESHPFTTLADWVNRLPGDALESEGIAATKHAVTPSHMQ